VLSSQSAQKASKYCDQLSSVMMSPRQALLQTQTLIKDLSDSFKICSDPPAMSFIQIAFLLPERFEPTRWLNTSPYDMLVSLNKLISSLLHHRSSTTPSLPFYMIYITQTTTVAPPCRHECFRLWMFLIMTVKAMGFTLDSQIGHKWWIVSSSMRVARLWWSQSSTRLQLLQSLQ